MKSVNPPAACGRQEAARLEDRKVTSLSPGRGNLVDRDKLQLQLENQN